MSKEASTKIMKFMALRSEVLVLGLGQGWAPVIILKNHLLYSQTFKRQIKYIVMMRKKVSTTFVIVKIMNPGSGVLVQLTYSEYALFLNQSSLFSTIGHLSGKLSACLGGARRYRTKLQKSWPMGRGIGVRAAL